MYGIRFLGWGGGKLTNWLAELYIYIHADSCIDDGDTEWHRHAAWSGLTRAAQFAGAAVFQLVVPGVCCTLHGVVAPSPQPRVSPLAPDSPDVLAVTSPRCRPATRATRPTRSVSPPMTTPPRPPPPPSPAPRTAGGGGWWSSAPSLRTSSRTAAPSPSACSTSSCWASSVRARRRRRGSARSSCRCLCSPGRWPEPPPTTSAAAGRRSPGGCWPLSASSPARSRGPSGRSASRSASCLASRSRSSTCPPSSSSLSTSRSGAPSPPVCIHHHRYVFTTTGMYSPPRVCIQYSPPVCIQHRYAFSTTGMYSAPLVCIQHHQYVFSTTGMYSAPPVCSVPARHIYEGAATCPCCRAPCPIYQRPEKKKIILQNVIAVFVFSDSRCKKACKMLADLCPCSHRSQDCAQILFRSRAGLCPNFGRSHVKVCPWSFTL